MKKVVFGITSLNLGGAERVLVDLANKLSENEKEYEITIFTIYSKGVLEKQLNTKIKLISIYNRQYSELTKLQKKAIIPLYILLAKNRIYKTFIQDKYDKEIAFLEGPVTRIFSSGNEKIKKVAWIHSDIRKIFGTGIKAKIKKKIDEKIYNKYNQIIFVSRDSLENFEKLYETKSNKNVIYNYIDSKKIIEKSKEYQPKELKQNEVNLVTVARLVQAKALDRFIKVHSKLQGEGIKHNLYIIGDGPEKERLQNLIEKENCEHTVFLLGAKENPYPYVKNADYFCLFSKFEGYGMVLEEAKILNKQILITDTAAKEAVQNYNRSTVFANSEEGIYKGLKETIAKKECNQNLEDNLEESYNNEEIIQKIKQLFN